jgi:hypothetical protein
MALQTVFNGHGFVLSPYPSPEVAQFSGGSSTMDAAGESYFGVGYLLLSSGPGTSATISAAGSGKIYYKTGAITFANGSTNLRVGIQDVAGTGLEDTTFDVQADLVGGVATITASVVNVATMTSGTKTITHGDLVAVGMEMTARGGADSVVVSRSGINSTVPYFTADTGSGPALGVGLPLFAVEFDNGVLGYFDGSGFPYLSDQSAAFSNASTPDEYALVFQLPFPASAVGAFVRISSASAADDFEVILYSDPLGTPVAERTIVQDMSFSSGNASTHFYGRTFSSAYNLLANTKYGVALRPTTANTIQFDRLNFNTGNGILRKATPLGTNWSLYSRSDQTGAFGSESLILMPLFGLWLSAFDDAVSAGGGLLRPVGTRGGLV